MEGVVVADFGGKRFDGFAMVAEAFSCVFHFESDEELVGAFSGVEFEEAGEVGAVNVAEFADFVHAAESSELLLDEVTATAVGGVAFVAEI